MPAIPKKPPGGVWPPGSYRDGCGYLGFEFGASYLDAACIEGWLWDLDSGDGAGLSHGGPDTGIACPHCQPGEYRRYFGCTGAERKRRVARAFGKTPWVSSNGPKAGEKA